MSFSAKRGRPCLHRQKKDTGTAELARRHAKGQTTEPLDMCLKRNLITLEEHAAGLHLRWLHSLRFGAPTVRAYDHTDVGGSNTCARDETWRMWRESEYEAAMKQLQAIHAHIIVANIAIFNRVPRFLLPPRTLGPLSRHTEITQQLHAEEQALLKEGLQLLYQLFSHMRYGKRKKSERPTGRGA